MQQEDILAPNYSVDYREKRNQEDPEKHEEYQGSRPRTKVVAKNKIYINKAKVNKSHSAEKDYIGKVRKKTFKTVTKNQKKYKILVYKFILSLFVLAITFTATVIIIHKFSSFSEEVSPTLAKNVNNINYSEFLAPVVMHDPEPFSSPEKAEKQMKISSSIWRCIMKNGTEKYQDYDERGLSLMPVKDIEEACTELFGPKHGVNFKERVFGSFYSLDENEKNFHICAISNQNSYIPYIECSEVNGDLLKLTVSYILREDSFFKEGPEKAQKPTPKKRMIYTLKKSDDNRNFYLESVENLG